MDIYKPPQTRTERVLSSGELCPFCDSPLRPSTLLVKFWSHKLYCGQCRNALNFRYLSLLILPGDILLLAATIGLTLFGTGYAFLYSWLWVIPFLVLLVSIYLAIGYVKKYLAVRLLKIVHYR